MNQESVFRVCDQPHPVLVGSVVKHCMEARIDDAYEGMRVRRYLGPLGSTAWVAGG